MRYFICLALVAAVAIGCGSDNGSTSPVGDPFSGSYDLATIGGRTLPLKFGTNAAGAYGVLRSVALSFPTFSSIVVSSSTDTYADAKASAVTVLQTDTYDLGRLPAQAFLLRQGSVADTVPAMIVPSINHLALDYRGAYGLGTYVFVRH